MRNKANGGVEAFTEYERPEEKHNLDGDHCHNIWPYQDFL